MQHTRGGARSGKVDVRQDPCMSRIWVTGVFMPVCIHSGGVGQVEGTLRVCNPRPKIRVPSYHIWKLGG